ncbi:hypothetical protein PIB30_094232, partial [Stylosanthes scabra]|nr:hypothetical protein [Stylosanthes scabra]
AEELGKPPLLEDKDVVTALLKRVRQQALKAKEIERGGRKSFKKTEWGAPVTNKEGATAAGKQGTMMAAKLWYGEWRRR